MSVSSAPAAVTANEQDIYTQARKLALNGERERAMAMLEKALGDAPNSDQQVLYGLILSWEGRYDEAREALAGVLAEDPANGDALAALINVHWWKGDTETALRVAVDAVEQHPDDARFLVRAARAYDRLKRPKEAKQYLRRAMRADSSNDEVRQLRRSMMDELADTSVGFDTYVEWFDDGRDPWKEALVEFNQRTPVGTAVTRVSYASRFGLGSSQVELDVHPKFRDGTYGFFNVGYSPDARLYPSTRFGGEVYQRLPYGFEGSAGYFQLNFQRNVGIYVGSLARYYGNWLFIGRVFVVPNQEGASRSFHWTARKYFNRRDFFGIRYAHGRAFERPRSVNDLAVLNSNGVYFRSRFSLTPRLKLWLRTGYSRQERVERAELNSLQASVGLQYLF